MGASRRTSFSLLFGLGAAGCMPHMGGAPSAHVDDRQTVQPAAHAADAPPLAPESDADRQRVVVDSVNDNVDRVSRILSDRAQAKQAAADVRELHEASAAKESKLLAAAASKASPADEATSVEQLAAALRSGKQIDPPAPAKTVAPANTNQPLSAAGPLGDNVDYGDEHPAGMAVAPFASALATMNVPTGMQLDRAPLPLPAVTRQSSVDPMLAVQDKFSSRVAEDPRDLSAQMELQLLRFLNSEPVPAMADLSVLPAEDRELLAAMGDALTNFRSVVKGIPNALGSEKARPFIEMADRIRARTDLNVATVTLCDVVRAYGSYDPIEPLKFTAGTPRLSILYCEVEGFLSQLNEKQEWESRLSLELRLYDDRGLSVWNLPPEVVTDACRRRRRDFFVAKKIQLPSNLRPGHYLLKASVKDVQANRIAESTMQFDVVPK